MRGQLHVSGLKTTGVSFCSSALSSYFFLNLIKQTWYRCFYIMNQSPLIRFEIIEKDKRYHTEVCQTATSVDEDLFTLPRQTSSLTRIFLKKKLSISPSLLVKSTDSLPHSLSYNLMFFQRLQWLTTKWKAPLLWMKLQIPLSLNI